MAINVQHLLYVLNNAHPGQSIATKFLQPKAKLHVSKLPWLICLIIEALTLPILGTRMSAAGHGLIIKFKLIML